MMNDDHVLTFFLDIIFARKKILMKNEKWQITLCLLFFSMGKKKNKKTNNTKIFMEKKFLDDHLGIFFSWAKNAYLFHEHEWFHGHLTILLWWILFFIFTSIFLCLTTWDWNIFFWWEKVLGRKGNKLIRDMLLYKLLWIWTRLWILQLRSTHMVRSKKIEKVKNMYNLLFFILFYFF